MRRTGLTLSFDHYQGGGDIARQAFDAVAAAQEAQSLSELRARTQTEFARLGFEIALGIHTRRHAAGANVELLFGDLDHPWSRHYDETDWPQRCPVGAAAGPRPMTWDDIRRRPLPPEQRVIFDELRAFRLTQGHIVAVDNGDNGTLAVSLAGDGFDASDPEARTAAHLLSLHYGFAGFDLLRRTRAKPDAVLTTRQIECLRWVRDGKTAWEIGSILGLSSRTVEEHLANACRALGVHSRIQAVILAARRGLFEL